MVMGRLMTTDCGRFAVQRRYARARSTVLTPHQRKQGEPYKISRIMPWTPLYRPSAPNAPEAPHSAFHLVRIDPSPVIGTLITN